MSRIIPTGKEHLRSGFTALSNDVGVHLESGELADWVSSGHQTACRRSRRFFKSK
ncbi:MAG: hypothetical protein ACR2IA_11945 [Pyrinomonadaceae bacterium]